MKIYIVLILALLGSICSFSASGAVRYDGDGELDASLEVQRWLINRGRYNPEADADRIGLVNAADRNYDVCEDAEGNNDFGTTPAEWAAYVTSRGPLAANAALSLSAGKHCQDMAETDLFQHHSPSGNFYPLNTMPWTRHGLESYPNSISGSMENLATRGRGSSGGFPSYGGTSPQFYQDLFVDTGVESRGHRKAIVNDDARELGLGWSRVNYEANGYNWTRDYTTQDYARSTGSHFFTGTFFSDGNGNGEYDEGEGVGGVEVHLFHNGAEPAYFDVSGAAGGFAIPIADLPEGGTVVVRLENPTGSDVTLSVPLGYTSTGTLTLTAGESRDVATFTQPAAADNVGLRNVEPIVDSRLSFSDGGMNFAFNAMPGITYVVEALDDPSAGTWQELDVMVADTDDEICVDTQVALHRFYRVRLITD